MEYDWFKISDPLREGENIIEENTVVRMTVHGSVLFLAHYDGRYFAGDNKCPHAGAPLHNGEINECGHIVCPYHRFTFDIENGQNTSGEGYFIQTYPIETRLNGIFIGMPKKKKWWPF